MSGNLRRAAELHRAGELRLARQLYEEILGTNPLNFDALHMLGVIELMTDRLVEGLDLINRAISVNPTDASAFRNRSLALRQLGRLEDSLVDIDRAVAINGRWTQLHCDSGVLLLQLRRPELALARFNTALAQDPGIAEAHLGVGNALCELGRWRDALASFARAISLRGNFVDALANCAVAFNELEQYSAAMECWTRALHLEPGNLGLRAQLCFARLRTCTWNGLESEIQPLLDGVGRGITVCDPFQMVAITDSLACHRAAAEQWVRAKWPADPSLGCNLVHESRERIRIGYFSADFHDHATSRLMAGVFEHHDRSQFHLTGFSFGPDSQDPVRRRVAAALDHFLDVRKLTDREIARQARGMQIDIAVDLNGHTRGGRAGIFALRAAPLQVNYLGFPGTSGADYMDYLIADRVVVPDHLLGGYSERLIHLPDSYQANDGSLEIADRRFSREELGLPEHGIIFCCFNNSFKITPEVFEVWMRILHRVPKSALWLLKDNELASANLCQEAARRAISPQRLVFAERVPLALHLARHRSADLFLDTLPYNAHTTASDALWAGVPLLTRTGESFASRVAASLLAAVGLPELITDNVEAFEDAAVSLATNPDRLARLRQKLDSNRRTTRLFDTKRFTGHLETAFRLILERHKRGLPPETLVLPQAGDLGH